MDEDPGLAQRGKIRKREREILKKLPSQNKRGWSLAAGRA